jgi:hypothetical protein
MIPATFQGAHRVWLADAFESRHNDRRLAAGADSHQILDAIEV